LFGARPSPQAGSPTSINDWIWIIAAVASDCGMTYHRFLPLFSASYVSALQPAGALAGLQLRFAALSVGKALPKPEIT